MITSEDICSQLNSLLSIDPVATQALLTTHFECSNRLLESDLINYVVREHEGGASISLRGFLNELLAKDGQRGIASVHDEDGRLVEFAVTDLKKGKRQVLEAVDEYGTWTVVKVVDIDAPNT